MRLSNMEFKTQIARIVENWPKDKMSQAQSDLIFKIARDFTGYDFQSVVNKLISSKSKMPLPDDFAAAFAVIRERNEQKKRAIYRNEVEAFYKSSMHPEEVKHVIQTVIRYMQGQASAEEFSAVRQTIEHMAKQEKNSMACKICIDGLVHTQMVSEDYTYVFKCTCPLGGQRVEKIPAWSDLRRANFTPLQTYSIAAGGQSRVN